MTDAVSSASAGNLDFTGNSIQLTTRKGADLLWVHRFLDSDENPLDIQSWIFTRDPSEPGGPNLPRVSSGGVRNGADATTGAPLTEEIDIVKIDSNPQTTNATYPVSEVEFIFANKNLNIIFPMNGLVDPVPADKFYRIIAGDFQFDFQSADVLVGSNAWQIIDPTALDLTTGMPPTQGFVDSQGYTLSEYNEAIKPAGFRDAIQCFFRTSTLTNVNPSSGRSNNAPFEIEAEVPSGRMTSGMDNLDPNGIPVPQAFNVITVVAAGQVRLFSDVYDASAS